MEEAPRGTVSCLSQRVASVRTRPPPRDEETTCHGLARTKLASRQQSTRQLGNEDRIAISAHSPVCEIQRPALPSANPSRVPLEGQITLPFWVRRHSSADARDDGIVVLTGGQGHGAHL